MPNVIDTISDWFCTKKGAERKEAVELLVAKRKTARRELDKAIVDATHARSTPWPRSARSSNSGR